MDLLILLSYEPNYKSNELDPINPSHGTTIVSKTSPSRTIGRERKQIDLSWIWTCCNGIIIERGRGIIYINKYICIYIQFFKIHVS